MKKVLLVVGYKTINYGSILQAYATQKLFEKVGVSVDILNLEILWPMTRKQRVIFYLRNGGIHNLFARKGGVYFSKVLRRFNKTYNTNYAHRISEFNAYVNKYLKLTDGVKNWDEASILARKYDAVVIGSDQVWVPSSVITDIYTLAFASDGQTKIAYAPSFGLNKIPRKFWGKYKEMLKSFDAISIREKSGAELIKEIAGVNCEVVADPVYMIDKGEWLDMVPDKILFNEPYIFVYLLGNNRWQRDFIAEYSKFCGIKTVALIHLDQYIGYDECYYDKKLMDAAPSDFLNLIRHAELIFTDSFHCMSFSIIENKEFYIFKRYKDNLKESTNSRLYSLFNLLHIDWDRMLTEISDVEEIGKKKLNYDEINCFFGEMQDSSWEFIEKAVR